MTGSIFHFPRLSVLELVGSVQLIISSKAFRFRVNRNHVFLDLTLRARHIPKSNFAHATIERTFAPHESGHLTDKEVALTEIEARNIPNRFGSFFSIDEDGSLAGRLIVSERHVIPFPGSQSLRNAVFRFACNLQMVFLQQRCITDTENQSSLASHNSIIVSKEININQCFVSNGCELGTGKQRYPHIIVIHTSHLHNPHGLVEDKINHISPLGNR